MSSSGGGGSEARLSMLPLISGGGRRLSESLSGSGGGGGGMGGSTRARTVSVLRTLSARESALRLLSVLRRLSERDSRLRPLPVLRSVSVACLSRRLVSVPFSDSASPVNLRPGWRVGVVGFESGWSGLVSSAFTRSRVVDVRGSLGAIDGLRLMVPCGWSLSNAFSDDLLELLPLQREMTLS